MLLCFSYLFNYGLFNFIFFKESAPQKKKKKKENPQFHLEMTLGNHILCV